MHCVDLGESFQTHIYLQNLASIQPRTGPFEFPSKPTPKIRRRGKVAARERAVHRREVLAFPVRDLVRHEALRLEADRGAFNARVVAGPVDAPKKSRTNV